VTQNALNNRVVHGQPIQVAPQAAACGVPAVPLRKGDIPFECVRGFPVTLALRLVASFAAIQRGQNDAVNNAAKGQRLAIDISENRSRLLFRFRWAGRTSLSF